jgi:hypothetical protein
VTLVYVVPVSVFCGARLQACRVDSRVDVQVHSSPLTAHSCAANPRWLPSSYRTPTVMEGIFS